MGWDEEYVGDEHDINIWQAPWLRDLDNPFIETSLDPGRDIAYVRELINPETGYWNVDLVNSVFTDRGSKQILSIPSGLDMMNTIFEEEDNTVQRTV